jgi:hypothetical protein
MDGMTLGFLGLALAVVVCAVASQRRRSARSEATLQNVRCPLHECQAEVTVLTDRTNRSRRPFVSVQGCSLLGDAAVSLPEQTAYLPDGPPYPVRLNLASTRPVYRATPSCPQHCVFALNEAEASAGPEPQPRLPVSMTSDAIELSRHVTQNPRIARLFWF